MADALKTARLTVRPLQVRDAAQLHQAFSDPEVMRYFDDPHQTLDQTNEWVHHAVNADPKQTREYTILLGDKVIGKAGIWKAPEIGFLLLRDQWRQGFAFEALTGLIPHVASTMKLQEITADVDPRNMASLTLLARLRFVQTRTAPRTIKIAGHWCDSVYLSLPLQPDWETPDA